MGNKHKNNLSSYFKSLLQLSLLYSLTVSCSPKEAENKYSIDIYQTSELGDNLKNIPSNQSIVGINPSNHLAIEIEPQKTFQKYIGFGASFTESSAWNLSTIPISKRKEVLNKLFSPTEGAGFSLTRTHINSCDYSNAHYSYVDPYDEDLSSFSVREDKKGFLSELNDQVKDIQIIDPDYDLIPMILEALGVEEAQFNIIASPWSPPSWMKNNETAEMTNGYLMPEYYGLWAKYLSKYVKAYKENGIKLWGITPQNEPLHAHDARWDSNGLTAIQGRDFLRDHLGPQLVEDGHMNLDNLDEGLRILIYDHNKPEMYDYVTPTYSDPEASKYAWGTAFHWYASSQLKDNNYYTEELDKLSST